MRVLVKATLVTHLYVELKERVPVSLRMEAAQHIQALSTDVLLGSIQTACIERVVDDKSHPLAENWSRP